jgi:drug/metabolite transporter (DMT)-like permease
MLIVRLNGAPWPTRKQWRDNALVGVCLLVGGNGVVAWAEQYVPSGITALLIGIQPVFMVLTEWAWPGGRRPGAAVFAGMLLGLVGVAWLFAPWETAQGGGLHVGGALSIFFACIAWAFGSIYSRHAKPSAPPFVGSAAQMLCGGVGLSLTALARGEVSHLDLSAISQRSWVAFGYLVLVGSLVGFSTFVWLMKHSTPARTSTYAYVNPVVAVFLGWLILDEPISPRTIAAAAIIVVAVAIVTTQTDKKRTVTDAKFSSPEPLRQR